MTMTYIAESTPTERAVLLIHWLHIGRELTTAEVADDLQISQRTAQRMFTAASRAGVPIYRDDDGVYRLLSDGVLQISPY
jgi:predicted DNA-binding transcriptional regulator YafY